MCNKVLGELAELTAMAHDAIRKVEQEQCCKDVCLFCEKGFPVKRMKHGLWAHGEGDSREYCQASAIHERAAKEKEA